MLELLLMDREKLVPVVLQKPVEGTVGEPPGDEQVVGAGKPVLYHVRERLVIRS